MKQVLRIILLVGSILPLSSVAHTYGNKNSIVTKKTDPEVVATLSDRDAIPLAFRAERMYCYVADNHKIYQLRGGVTNAHWVELDIASSMKIQGPAGSLPYIDPTGLLATDLRYLGKAKYDFSGANILGSGQYVNVNGIGNTVNDRSHNSLNAYNSYSDGNYVLMVGERDSALGHSGVILGSDISLRANHQFAAGKGLVAQTAGEILFGQYNQYAGSSSNQWLGSDKLLTLGNGTGMNNRSNALVIYKNGDAVFSGDVSAANLYSKLQVDSMFVVNGGGGGTGVVQSLNLSGTALTITGSNTVNFSGWDTDASDDFSGDYNDLINAPAAFSGSYNDLTNKPALFSGNYNDLTNKPNFAGWDTDASDDFSGDYNDLINVPVAFSGNYNDLTNKPALFSGDYNDLVNKPSFAGWDTDASDDFNGDYNALTNKPTLFSGDYNDLNNKPSFAGWDTDASDDFNGDYNALTNKPDFSGWDTDASDDFSGDYNDLNNLPDIYVKSQVDSAIIAGVNGSAIQNLNLNGTNLNISGGNTVNFLGWDTDASDDFSGDYTDLVNTPTLFSGSYNDLTNKPNLFSGDYNDLNNRPSFNGWDKNAADDFSGDYMDLINRPNFIGWDTDASDDFSGDYNDLINQPALFSGSYNDLSNKPSFVGWDTDASDDFNGDYNALTNLPDFTGWDTDASDDFNGDYNNLTNQPNFTGWDMDASDDFSGDYNALTNKPNLFSGDYNDLSNKPSVYSKLQVDSMFVVNGGGGGGTVQNLNLAGSQLTITGGNTVNFSGWDTDASDDFSGDYNDLSNTPALFSGSYADLTNKPSFAGWDTDASDDFSGDFNDLSNLPNFAAWDQNAADDFSGDYADLTNTPTLFSGNYNDLTNKPKLFDGDYNKLLNKPTFSGWDTDASDDFSGDYNDLVNLPNLYNKNQVDSAIAANAGSGGLSQNLNLAGSTLSITGGNSVNFAGWDMDASDDFSGVYSDLNSIPTDFADGKISWNELDAKPQLYTAAEVDSIKQGLIDSLESYVDSAVISQAHAELTSNRNLAKQDCGKTVYVKSSTAILTIPNGANLPFNSHIELRDFGSGALILDASAVTLRDAAGDVISGNTSAIVIEDVAITAIGNDEFKIIGLYQ